MLVDQLTFSRAMRELIDNGATTVPAGFEPLERLQNSMQRLHRMDPDATALAVAQDALDSYFVTELVPILDPECPAEATAQFDAAEQAFQAGRYKDALKSYDAALAGCPSNATWWTYSGDAALSTQGTRAAITRYDKAIALSPCHHMALRFKANATLRLTDLTSEDVTDALEAAVASVACKPDYRAGWSTLSTWGESIDRVVLTHSMEQLDPEGMTALAEATATRSESNPLDRRVAALQQLQKSGSDSLFVDITRAFDDPAALRAIVAWETLDAEIEAQFRTLRVEQRDLLIAWVLASRVHEAE